MVSFLLVLSTLGIIDLFQIRHLEPIPVTQKVTSAHQRHRPMSPMSTVLKSTSVICRDNCRDWGG